MATRLLYLARHGEQDRSAGAPPGVDPPETGLSDRGRRQATLLGERLRDVPFVAVHHSPLRRAVPGCRRNTGCDGEPAAG